MARDETLRERSRAAAVDAFLLAGPERVASGYSSALRQDMRALHRAGDVQARAADLLADGNPASALELYREAAVLYIAAFLTVRSGVVVTAPIDAHDVIDRFRELPPVPGAPDELDGFLDDVSGAGRAAWPRPGAFSDDALADRARRVVAWLARLVEPREVKEIRFARWFRLGVTTVAVTAALAMFVDNLLSRENLALHKPVTFSAPNPAAPFPPGGLTDGDRSGTYGVHTASGEASWVQVDLQASYALSTVKIYNRGDGWFDDGLPMTLQVSQNGRDFVDVATRTTHFSQTFPWKIELGHRQARYLRVRAARGRYVALSELEAFGEKSSAVAPPVH